MFDERKKKGQFILTSSSTPKRKQNRVHSGGDQIGKLKMRTMSLYDSGDSSGIAPSVMCVLCGMTNAVYQRPDGVYVVPITALKN